MTYRELAKYAKANARRRARTFTRPDDDWPMTVLADFPGEPVTVFDLPDWIANSHSAKAALGQALAAGAQLTKPTKVAMIASAWVIVRPVDEPLPDRPPSEHADRREIVIVVVADAERSEGWVAEIKRSGTRPPTLGPFESGGDPGVGGQLIEPLIEALR